MSQQLRFRAPAKREAQQQQHQRSQRGSSSFHRHQRSTDTLETVIQFRQHCGPIVAISEPDHAGRQRPNFHSYLPARRSWAEGRLVLIYRPIDDFKEHSRLSISASSPHRHRPSAPAYAEHRLRRLIHSDHCQIDRSSSISRHESRNCRKGHPGGPPST